jgi:hypothetical protein
VIDAGVLMFNVAAVEVRSAAVHVPLITTLYLYPFIEALALVIVNVAVVVPEYGAELVMLV